MASQHVIQDFMVGSNYTTTTGQTCQCTAVTDTFIRVTFNNETAIKYTKQLFAGTFVALKCRTSVYILTKSKAHCGHIN